MLWASIHLPSSPQGQVQTTGASPAPQHLQKYPRQPTPPFSASSPGLPIPPMDGQPCPHLQCLLPGTPPRGPAQQASHFRGTVNSFPSITSAFMCLTGYNDSEPPDAWSRSRLPCRCMKLPRFWTCPGGVAGHSAAQALCGVDRTLGAPHGLQQTLTGPPVGAGPGHLGHVSRPVRGAGCVPMKPAGPSPGVGPDVQA